MQIPIKDQQNIWKWIHALDGFEQAQYALNSIINNDANDFKMFKNILTAFYVNYAKPFGKNWGVERLDTIIIPKEYLTLHTEILHYRDKFFAHSDLYAESNIGNEFIDNMQLAVNNGTVGWELRYYFPTKDQYVKYQHLINTLIVKCNYHINKLNLKYLTKIPFQDGIYNLNIRGESEFTFTKLK